MPNATKAKSVTKRLQKKPLNAQSQTNKKLTVKDHYRGMPEYVQEAVIPTRKIIVHFLTEHAVLKFFKLVNQIYTPKTKSLWFPEVNQDKMMDKRYSDKYPLTNKKRKPLTIVK